MKVKVLLCMQPTGLQTPDPEEGPPKYPPQGVMLNGEVIHLILIFQLNLLLAPPQPSTFWSIWPSTGLSGLTLLARLGKYHFSPP